MITLFRAKYVVLLSGGESRLLLLPPGEAPLPAGLPGYPAARGHCLLHLLGGGTLGFTVEGPHSRPQDAKLLESTYLVPDGPGAIQPGEPFSTRIPPTRRTEP